MPQTLPARVADEIIELVFANQARVDECRGEHIARDTSNAFQKKSLTHSLHVLSL